MAKYKKKQIETYVESGLDKCETRHDKILNNIVGINLDCDVDTVKDGERSEEKANETESTAEKELVLIRLWKKMCDDLSSQLDVSKSKRSYWQGECNKLQKKFDAAYNRGWQDMANQNPLFNGHGIDPDEWKNQLIDDTDMDDSLKEKVSDHFATVGELSDWINLDFTEKKSGITQKTKDQIITWFDIFWKSK